MKKILFYYPDSAQNSFTRISEEVRARIFYESIFEKDQYGTRKPPHLDKVANLLAKVTNAPGVVLEIGTGRGKTNYLPQHYVGLDVSEVALKQHPAQGRVVCGSAENLPICTESCKMVFTIACMEHVLTPEQAFEEIDRVLAPGGILFLAVAWHVRPWAKEGLNVRPFRDLTFRQKVIKTFIPLRNNKLWRGFWALPKRLVRRAAWYIQSRPTQLNYKKLRANYEVFWCSDSDATASIDSHEGLLFFESRGYDIVSHKGFFDKLLADSRPVVAHKLQSSYHAI